MTKASRIAFAMLASWMVAHDALAATDDQIACANSVRQESADACTRALAQSDLSRTDRAMAHFNRGWSLRRSGASDLAVKDFDAAQALQEFPKLYFSRALAKQDLGKLDGAVQDLERYIAMAPQDWSGFQHRAAIYREQGFTAKALQDIDSALRLNPFNNELMVMKVLTLAETSNLDAAKEEADRLVSRPALATLGAWEPSHRWPPNRIVSAFSSSTAGAALPHPLAARVVGYPPTRLRLACPPWMAHL